MTTPIDPKLAPTEDEGPEYQLDETITELSGWMNDERPMLPVETAQSSLYWLQWLRAEVERLRSTQQKVAMLAACLNRSHHLVLLPEASQRTVAVIMMLSAVGVDTGEADRLLADCAKIPPDDDVSLEVPSPEKLDRKDPTDEGR